MLNRIERNLLPPAAYSTYTIAIPLATHWRPATCGEVECLQYLNGWQSLIDEGTELGQRQAHYIRHDRTRRHTEERTPEGLTAFSFGPGQQCFAGGHKMQNGRPERYIQRGGDHRGNPGGRVIEHSGPAPWVDSFGENQERLAAAQERG